MKQCDMRSTSHDKLLPELLLQESPWDAQRDGSSKFAARADGEGLSESDYLLAILTGPRRTHPHSIDGRAVAPSTRTHTRQCSHAPTRKRMSTPRLDPCPCHAHAHAHAHPHAMPMPMPTPTHTHVLCSTRTTLRLIRRQLRTPNRRALELLFLCHHLLGLRVHVHSPPVGGCRHPCRPAPPICAHHARCRHRQKDGGAARDAWWRWRRWRRWPRAGEATSARAARLASTLLP